MNATPKPSTKLPHRLTGVGLGLRWEFIAEVAATAQPLALPFFEISPENYMRRGGYFPAVLREVASRFPLLSHGLMLNIGSADPLDRDYLRQLGDFLRDLAVPYHSDHLCWTGFQGTTLHDLLPLPCSPRMIPRIVDRVRHVQDTLGMPFALENISYYARLDGDMPELEFLCEILDRADSLLLLDVNNLYVNATNHGFDPYAYLAALPLARVVQLHVAGGEVRPDLDHLLIDTHGSGVSDPVVDLMSWVVARVGPVPVVYERDHDIPDLPRLLSEVERLQSAYIQAEQTYHEGRASSGGDVGIEKIATHSLASASELTTEDEIMRGFSRAILASSALGSDIADDLRECKLVPEALHALIAVGTTRLAVYRHLVRGGLTHTIRQFLERSRACRGPTFEVDVDEWLARHGPRSKYLRDIPLEFARWMAPKWREDPHAPRHLCDLARHELIEYIVSAASEAEVIGSPRELELTSKLSFHPSATLIDYAHAVHELPDDVSDATPPRPEPTTLLAYRDATHRVRYLKLTVLGRALVSSWLEGSPLDESLRQAAQATKMPIDDELIHRVADLISDLHARGIVLGPAG